MALPATNITLSAVNTELGNASTAAVTLNTPRVRSLGSNLGASGTTFNMSGLASKSATWALGTAAATTGSAGNAANLITVICPAADQTCFYTVSTDQSVYTIQLKKNYINGNLASNFDISETASNTADCKGAGVGPYSTSNIYMTVSGGVVQNVAKVSPNGSVLQSIRLLGPAGNYAFFEGLHTRVIVDASENVYVTVAAQISAGSSYYAYYLVSVDSSLNIRWSKALPPYNLSSTSASNPDYFVRGLSLDSSGNVYMTYRQYLGSPTSSYVGFVKYNASGTELLNRAFTFTTSPNSLPFTNSRAGIGVSGEVAMVSAAGNSQQTYITYYNNAGTIQWSRLISYANSGYQSVYDADCIMDSANNIYALYYIVADSTNTSRAWLVKFNSSGTLLWQRCFTNIVAPYYAISPSTNALILTGNDSLISITFGCGFYDEYSSTLNPATITVKTDGSGIGTYALTSLCTLSYQTTPVLTVTSNTATVVTGVTPSTSSFTKQAGTAVNVPATTNAQTLINI